MGRKGREMIRAPMSGVRGKGVSAPEGEEGVVGIEAESGRRGGKEGKVGRRWRGSFRWQGRAGRNAGIMA